MIHQVKMLIFNTEKVKYSIICYVFLVNACVAINVSLNRNCDQLPLKVLKRLHGPAFDSRYMSISEPKDIDDDYLMDDNENFNRKRADNYRPAFYIDEEHTIPLSDEPAWNIQWDVFGELSQSANTRGKRSPVPIGESEENQRLKRQSTNNRLFNEISCEKRVKWVHLGPDYHPSHLRTIECTKSTCFYSHGSCRPRHFAVRILKRRQGVCANASSLKSYGYFSKQAEVWEWIEVAVNFCCECVAHDLL